MDCPAQQATATISLSLRSMPSRGCRTGTTVKRYSKSSSANVRTRINDDRRSKPILKGMRRLMILTAILGAGSIFAFTDTARHSYTATKRSLRVLFALIRSVRE